MTLDDQTRAALADWVDFFRETIIENRGPISMAANFESTAGPWSLICSREGGCKIVPPLGHGQAQNVDEWLAAQELV